MLFSWKQAIVQFMRLRIYQPYPLQLGYPATKTGCLEYDSKLNRVMKHQFWRSEECVVFFCYYSQFHYEPEWKYLFGFYLWIK